MEELREQFGDGTDLHITVVAIVAAVVENQHPSGALIALIGLRTDPCRGDGIPFGKHGEAHVFIQRQGLLQVCERTFEACASQIKNQGVDLIQGGESQST